jgi:hypothetical protein
LGGLGGALRRGRSGVGPRLGRGSQVDPQGVGELEVVLGQEQDEVAVVVLGELVGWGEGVRLLGLVQPVLIVVDLLEGARIGRLEALLGGRRRQRGVPDVHVDLGDAVVQVSEQPLADAGVDDGHGLRVRRVQVPLHLADAVRVAGLVLVDPLDVEAAVPLEVAHGELQDVGLLQLGVLGVVRLGRVEDEGLEGGEALVDSRPAALLHQGFVGSSRFGGPLVLRGHNYSVDHGSRRDVCGVGEDRPYWCSTSRAMRRSGRVV